MDIMKNRREYGSNHSPKERQLIEQRNELWEQVEQPRWESNPNADAEHYRERMGISEDAETSIKATLTKPPFEGWTVGINPMRGDKFKFYVFAPEENEDYDELESLGGIGEGYASQMEAEIGLAEFLLNAQPKLENQLELLQYRKSKEAGKEE